MIKLSLMGVWGVLIPIFVSSRGVLVSFVGVWRECRWVKYRTNSDLQYAGGGTPAMLGHERLISIRNLASLVSDF